MHKVEILTDPLGGCNTGPAEGAVTVEVSELLTFFFKLTCKWKIEQLQLGLD